LRPPLAIDHAVIAVRDLDRAAESFARLGFTLTPRGFHSIGSQNHCIMLRSNYIELLAAPVAHPWLDYYRAFLARDEGLAAIAFATDDADATYAQLKQAGAPAKPPMDLSRPVEGGIARFRLVQSEDTRFYVQHLTPQLVWRPQWQAHANGSSELLSAELGQPGKMKLKGNGTNVEVHGVRLEFS
jgi:catechol 2,3-dioxygenase-like lactoylglutathione lyase family enzyme